MPLTKRQIKTAALALNAAEREALAEDLLRSINKAEQRAIDAAWLAEARRRDAAFRTGKTEARPVDEVIERVRRGTRR